MRIHTTFSRYKSGFKRSLSCLKLILLFAFINTDTKAQNCPYNIDFETGNFTGWTCYTGFVSGANGQNIISLVPSGGPVENRHTMYSAYPGDGVDAYGGFPINCPNGSGHSIRLGNDQGGGEAEGISYDFTIPANQNTYSIIYNYAVIFQDPNHQQFQQPRMEIEVTNVTDNIDISCSSFTFIPFGSPLPGFFISSNPNGDTPVWCKDWTAVSVNLNGYAGKTIRLFFKTADCTFRKHFGYAYIDVNSECSGTFVGATYCPDDTAVNVVAPFGYESYTWYNNTFTQVLGNQQILTLAPPPPSGTTIAVVLAPYSGYGCVDTLFAQLIDTLTVVANAGRDTVSCNHNPVPIGSIPRPGLVYKWNPVTGLSNPNIANPYASPDSTTTYVITTNHNGGGCISTDTVTVFASLVNDSLELIGKPAFCIGSGDSALLRVHPTDSIQWFKDNNPIIGANQTDYRVTQTGNYYARLISHSVCTVNTRTQQINIASVPVAAFSVDKSGQCLVGNRFVFSNSSTNLVGPMTYNWLLGDNTGSSDRDVIHSYTAAGNYLVKLIVSSNSTCGDTSAFSVNVFQNAIADFSVKPVCVNLPLQLINNTVDTIGSPIHYLWNFSNGQTANIKNPPPQTYQQPGTYPITLSVYTNQCPLPGNTLRRFVVVDKPKSPLNYPSQFAVINLPLTLHARQIGKSAVWNPGINLNDRTSYNPVFKSATENLYTIELTTISGCVTVDTQLVKIIKNVEIFVPNAFSPNNDGLNDYLKPILRGITAFHYFKIFNRAGELLFQMTNDQQGWDGKFRGVAQDTQAIVWIFEGVGVDGKLYNTKGSSVLLR